MSKPELECILLHCSGLGFKSRTMGGDISVEVRVVCGREWAPEHDFTWDSLILWTTPLVLAQCENAFFRMEPRGSS